MKDFGSDGETLGVGVRSVRGCNCRKVKVNDVNGSCALSTGLLRGGTLFVRTGDTLSKLLMLRWDNICL